MLKKFQSDETGLELTEYAMAAALVTLAVVVSITALGNNVTSVIGNLASFIK